MLMPGCITQMYQHQKWVFEAQNLEGKRKLIDVLSHPPDFIDEENPKRFKFR